jgi:hypothetical protein
MKLSEDIELVRYVLATAGGKDVRDAFDRILAPRCVDEELTEAVEKLGLFLVNDALVHPGHERAGARGAFSLIEEAINNTHSAPHPANTPEIDAALAAAQSDADLLNAIDGVVARGGDVTVRANDPLNPINNAQARVVTDIGLRHPTNEMRGGDTAREALANALRAVRVLK